MSVLDVYKSHLAQHIFYRYSDRQQFLKTNLILFYVHFRGAFRGVNNAVATRFSNLQNNFLIYNRRAKSAFNLVKGVCKCNLVGVYNKNKAGTGLM